MRRTLTALVGAAVLAAGVIPAAAGAADAPARRRHLRLACEVVRHEQLPAVACKWSGPDWIMAAANDTAVDATFAPTKPAGFRLWRSGRMERPHVVYRGQDHGHTDATVRQGRRYAFRVEAIDFRGRTVARSNVVRVKIPSPPMEALKLDCQVVDVPSPAAQDVAVVRPIPAVPRAVACEWSKSERRDFAGYRLFRAPGASKKDNAFAPDNARQVIYRGDAQRFLDTDVKAGQRYRYLVQSVNHWGLAIGHSDVVHVAVPPRITPQPDPLPLPVDPVPVPLPDPKPEPVPGPRPIPVPEPKPTPVPGPKPIPVPDPKPVPRPEMKLGCRLMDTTDRNATADPATTNAMSIRPTPAVACRWSELGDRKVAGYRLWRADPGSGVSPDARNTGRKVIFETRTETSFVDGSVERGHTYLYGVQAIGPDGGVVATSEPVKVSVPGDPPTPGTDPAPPVKAYATNG